MKTFSLKPADVKREWYILDASQAPLGRLATRAASLLIGKGKPSFTPHVDGGDFVIVVNAANLRVTGEKEKDKIYYNHSGYQSGLRERRLGDLKAQNPTEIVQLAVRGMLPHNKLQPGRLMRLKIYADDDHKHQPQQPIQINMSKEGESV